MTTSLFHKSKHSTHEVWLVVNIKRRNVVKGIAVASAAAAFNPGILFADGRGPTAIVIGSGIAGLSAAWELKQSGFRVTVFEKQHMAGGRMRQDWMGPMYGPVHAVGLWTGNTEMWDLAEELGLGNELADQPDYPIMSGVLLNNGHGSYTTTPIFDLASLTQIPGMSSETKQRLPSLIPDLEEIAQSGADPCLLHTCAEFDDESMWDYLARKLGKTGAREFLDFWYQQMWLDVWHWKAETSSRMATLPFVAQTGNRWIVPTAGIDVLVRTLARRIDVLVNTTVRRISPVNNQGKHTVHYLSPTGERLTATPDVVVSAVEGNFVLPMVEGLAEREKNFFRQIHMIQSQNITYILKAGSGPAEPAGTDYSSDGVPTPNHPHSRKKLGNWTVIPANPGDYQQRPALAYTMDRSRENEWRASGQSLADFCLPLVQQQYPGINADNIDDIVVRGGDYVIHVPTGFARAVSGFHQMQNKERRGLYFAGEFLGNAHTGGACAAGRTVGRSIARHWT